MELKQTIFKPAPNVKTMINIGAGFDIPTGEYYVGLYGEHILNGGLGVLTGFAGMGNVFKSTIEHYSMYTALARMAGSTASTYDTEINIHESHLRRMYTRCHELNGEDIIESGRWIITDKTVYSGDEWFDLAKEYMQDKVKNSRYITVKTPFINRERNGNLEIIQPTFTEVDSLSEFTTNDVVKMQDDNSLGESGGNTVFMRQGLQKNRFLAEIPGLSNSSYNYTLMVAQIGDKFDMDPRNPKANKLAYLKGEIKIKGVPEKFTFVMNNCWHAYGSTPLINDNTKAPEYPRNSDDDTRGDTDLTLVRLRQLRSKSGPSGITLEIVVSQKDGVLPDLTSFHHLKENGRFGFEGNVQNYNIVLCPDIKLSRTSVRGKIENHPELRRALNILHEFCQIHDYWHQIDPALKCTPKELYDGIKDLGYDWDQLLKTRGWWALVGSFEDIPFLSTMDIMLMRVGKYIPYWMENPPQKALDLYEKTMGKKWSTTYKKSKK